MISRIQDAELRDSIRSILARLELLADGGTASIENSVRSSETPLGPPGFANITQSKCPPEGRSLYDHFKWRFENAIRSGASNKKLYFLLWEAEKAYETRVMPPDPENPRVALILTRADEDTLKRRIVETYEGEHSYRVHLDLNLPQGWIEKVREESGREPETGYLRPKWRKLHDSEKRSFIRSLRQQGKTQQETARWLGISRRTVATWDKAA